MNRIGIVLALALASLASVACSASTDGGDENGSDQTEDKLAIGMQQQGGSGTYTCHRFPTDTCIGICGRSGTVSCTIDDVCTCTRAVAATTRLAQ